MAMDELNMSRRSTARQDPAQGGEGLALFERNRPGMRMESMKRVIQVTCKMLRKARFTMATWSGALVLAVLLTGGVPDA